MANILSQDEVDSLLNGIDEGSVQTETDTSEKGKEAEVYDFRTLASSRHQGMPGLKIINERFLALLRTSLPLASKSVTDITLSSIDSIKYSDFCLSVPMPSSLNIFSMEPLRGFSLLVLEGPLVFSMVERFLGGSGVSHVKLEGRSFTAVETMIIARIVHIILNDLQQAWSEVHDVKTVFSHSEMDSQFVAIVKPDDVVLNIKFAVHLETGSGTFTICIPYHTIEPIKDKLKTNMHAENFQTDDSWKRYLMEKIGQISVGLSCIMGMAKINGRELLEMKVDDVIQLDQKLGDPITVNIEGIPKFRGFPGSCKNNKAVRLSKGTNEE
jgi:flagellar motor switch protein FliM